MDKTKEAVMADTKELDRRQAARVRAARVNVRNARKLGITPEDRIIEIAETPMREGDHFDAREVLGKRSKLAG